GAAVMGSNVIALVFTVVFGRLLHSSGYGSLAALIAAFVILQVPGSALQATVAREVSTEVAVGERAPGAGVRTWIARLMLVLFAAGLGVTGAFFGTALSLASMAVIVALPLYKEIARGAVGRPVGPEPGLRELLVRAGAPVVALALIAFLQNIDLIVVKHRVGG